MAYCVAIPKTSITRPGEYPPIMRAFQISIVDGKPVEREIKVMPVFDDQGWFDRDATGKAAIAELERSNESNISKQ